MSKSLSDAVFPGLSNALDVVRVRSELRNTLPECNDGLIVEEVKIYNVQYRPRKSCVILYQVKFRRGASGRSVTQQLAGHLIPEGHDVPDRDAAREDAYRALEDLPLRCPVVHLPRFGLVAYAYPFDPRLTGLIDATDPVRVREELSGLWKRRSTRVRRVTVDTLGYTPHARAALHYEVLSEDRESKLPEVRHLVGKIDAQRDAAELFARSWAVWKAASQRIRLAAPVGFLPGLNLWLQERVDGVRLADLAGSGSLISPLRHTAGYLAVLHELSLPLRSRRAAAHHVKAVRRWGGMIAAIRPEDGDRVRDLRDRLASQLENRAQMTGPVHGDLHPANVLVAGPRVTLVDLDNMSLGDRLLDVGRFMSALRISSLRAFGTLDGLADARESFLERYLSQTGEDESRARLFEAASLIISAGTGFRLQREGWNETAPLLIDEAQRVLELAKDSSRTAVAAAPPSSELRGHQKHDWAIDEVYMSAALEPHVRSLFGVQLTKCSCERKAHGARRDRLRYDVTGLRGSERCRIALDGMLWHGNRGGRASRRLAAVSTALEQVSHAPILPRPVAYLRDAGIQILQLPEGTSFEECLRTDAGPLAVTALARALDALRRTETSLQRVHSMDAELRGLRSRAARLEGSAIGLQANRLIDRIAPALTQAPEPFVPAIRHLSPRRLVLVGDHVGLTEVDDFATAHPMLDAADFLGRLTVLLLNDGGATIKKSLPELFRTSFLDSWSGTSRLAPFEAAALIRHACVEADREEASPLAGRLLEAATQCLEPTHVERTR